MKKIGVLIRNHSPILLGEQKWYFEKVLRTRKYIPGVYLRGAITDQLLRGRTNIDQYFDQLICDSHRWGTEIVFPNCYPNLNAYTFPMLLPVTAKSCRWKPGFVHDGNFDEEHGVFDTLLNQIIFQQIVASSTESGRPSRSLTLVQNAYRTLIEQGTLHCNVCHELANSYQVDYAKPHGKFWEIPVQTYQQSKSSLSRNHRKRQQEESSSEQSQFIECISERTWFLGFSFLPDDPSLIKLYKDSLESITHLGEPADKGKGRGKVEVRVKEIDDHTLSLRQRVLQFNQKYREMQEDYSVRKTGEVITVNLQSEAILRDRDGRTTSRLSASFLVEELRRIYRRMYAEELSDLETRCRELISVTQPTYVTGWHSGWRPTDEAVPAIARGSVFAFSFPYLSARLLSALECLEKQGIGESKREGYGQVLICDPFHLEVPLPRASSDLYKGVRHSPFKAPLFHKAGHNIH
ncbi:MAG: hypothetical protein AB1847_18260 [bacterium]